MLQLQEELLLIIYISIERSLLYLLLTFVEQIALSGSPSGTIHTFSGLLSQANYTVEVVDSTRVCTDMESVFLNGGLTVDWDAIEATIVNDTCLETPTDIGDGSITVTSAQTSNLITGGSGNFSFSWEGQTSVGTRTFSGPDINGLVPGAYTLTVLDQVYLCDTSYTFYVKGPPALSIVMDPILTSPRESAWYPKAVTGSASSSVSSGSTSSSTVTINELIYLDCIGDLADMAIEVTGAVSASVSSISIDPTYTVQWFKNGVTSSPQHQITLKPLLGQGPGIYFAEVTTSLRLPRKILF